MTYSHLQGINIGSGQHYAEDWLNTDIIPTDKGKQPDLLLNIHDYKTTFTQHEFRKAYVGHVLEHIPLDEMTDVIQSIAYIAKEIMVVGPCIEKAIATDQPQYLIDGIAASEGTNVHPWSHKWTPTEELTFNLIKQAGYDPVIVEIKTVKKPEWPNPTVASWQTAMKFTS
jgi:predicted SAM-dependent methyltransferase